MKLNIGCGTTKIEGFINLDINPDCNPDIVHDFRKGLPYPNEHFDEIVCFHIIEHIEKKFHQSLLRDIHRALKPTGKFYITFPDFWKCAEYWKENKRGDRKFWEDTIFGRQAYPGDYHVCICTLDQMSRQLSGIGFDPYYQGYEPYPNEINAVIKCTKDKHFTYQEGLKEMNSNTNIEELIAK